MKQKMGLVSYLVQDYDEAIRWFTQQLGFTLQSDIALGADKRWVVVMPPGAAETGLLLAKATTAAQARLIGNQAGGRVFLFLNTDDFARDYAAMQSRGISFLETPRVETYGTVAVFADLYGNKWDLLELKH